MTALCPDASNPANGVVSQSGNSVGDMATYTCNDGLDLRLSTARVMEPGITILQSVNVS